VFDVFLSRRPIFSSFPPNQSYICGVTTEISSVSPLPWNKLGRFLRHLPPSSLIRKILPSWVGYFLYPRREVDDFLFSRFSFFVARAPDSLTREVTLFRRWCCSLQYARRALLWQFMSGSVALYVRVAVSSRIRAGLNPPGTMRDAIFLYADTFFLSLN